MATISSVRDFGIIFNAYMKFEESMIDLEADTSQADQNGSDEDSD
eukprot:CAMPEP_0116871034 /NCGR_PEP_ID=MMETSP0463-20121206/1207_1 /TAXON_ID=181622 /ORGANISM="Strombidinopsis sp, Strain SopsisLIS2011" /LENGTH=44 /DNA_ID= /DNA_START= /DNA_END= /DNA_ORIENTATION=